MRSALLLSLGFLAFAHPAKSQNAGRSSETDILTIYKTSHVYKIVTVGDKMTEFDVDDEKITGNGLSKYDSLIAQLKEDLRKGNTAGADDEDDAYDERHAEQELAEAYLNQAEAYREVRNISYSSRRECRISKRTAKTEKK